MGAFTYDVRKILEMFTLPLSATVSIKRPPPPLMTSAFARPPHFKEPPTQFTNSNTKCLSYPA